MTLSALLLVLAAAILHATWNLAAKAKRGDSYLFVWWYTAVAALVTLPTGAVILARESAAGAPPEPALLWAPMVAAVLHIGYNLCLQTGYDRAPLSIVYPTARGTGPVLTMITAILLLGERPGLGAMAGAVVVILGIVLAALPARSERLTIPNPAPEAPGTFAPGNDAAAPGPSASPLRAGVLWGGATGVFIAGYTLWDDHSMAVLGLSAVPYFALCTLFQLLFMTLRLGRKRRSMLLQTLRENRWVVLTVGLASPAAYILVLYVMQTQPVSLVAPLRETSIVIGSLAAWLIFHEPSPPRRRWAAVVVLAGVSLIAL